MSEYVLVTGATGYAGGCLARKLAQSGEKVRALARPTSRKDALTDHGIEIVEGDITSRADVDRAARGVEKVYHLAACYRTANHPNSYYWQVNVGGTENVLAAARKHGCLRVVHCSTVGVHGSVRHSPADETAPFSPGDIYQTTKLEGEKRAVQASASGQPVAIFRPAAIYGPGDTRLLKLFKAIQRRYFMMFGPGTVNYHLVYIDDLVQGIMLCGSKDEAVGEAFILCGPNYCSLNELVALVAAATGVDMPRTRLPMMPLMASAVVCEALCKPLGIDPPVHKRRAEFFIKNRAFSCHKATRQLGYAPSVEAEEGLKRTADWYVSRGLL